MSITLPPLPDIDQVEPVSAADDAIFAEIRTVLERHGALSRFGVTLLHQHFDISDDEALVESVDKVNRVLTTSPAPKNGGVPTVETSWRLDSPDGTRRCETQCNRPYGPSGPHIPQHYTVG